MTITIWHNPRCSKSRQTLALVRDRAEASGGGRELRIVRYLDDPPSAERLRWVLERLGLRPRELMRTKEALYRELGLADPALSDGALIEAMVAHPRLIERPVVIVGDRAALGRPPESVLELLE